MKHAVNKSVMRSMMLCLAISLLSSCKKEMRDAPPEPVDKEAVSQSVSEKEINIQSSPVKAESPTFRNEIEETGTSLFPNKALAGARAATVGTTDFVDFDDEMALTIIPEHAASTFATEPFYIQQVGSAWVHVKENNSGNYKPAFKSNYGHIHLSYETFEPCITQNGKFGKPSGGGCSVINPVKEPRVLNTHMGDHWVKINAYDYNSPSRIFDLLGLKVTKGPIQLWFRKSNGDWSHWSSIGVGTWNLSAHCTSIKEVLISSTGNEQSIGFDNVKILMPSF